MCDASESCTAELKHNNEQTHAQFTPSYGLDAPRLPCLINLLYCAAGVATTGTSGCPLQRKKPLLLLLLLCILLTLVMGKMSESLQREQTIQRRENKKGWMKINTWSQPQTEDFLPYQSSLFTR